MTPKIFLRKVATLFRICAKPISRRDFIYGLLVRSGVHSIKVQIKRAGKMWLNLDDRVLGYWFFIHREYESFESSLFERLIKRGMTVVDVGANIGYYSMIASHAVGDTGRVFSLEPDPVNFSFLEKNVGLLPHRNVEAQRIALMSNDGEAFLYRSSDNFGDHRVFAPGNSAKTDEAPPIKINGRSLDSFALENAISPDIIKIDIQGAEIDALKGMEKTLSKKEILVLFEFWPWGLRENNSQPMDLLRFFLDRGFKLLEITGDKLPLTPVDPDELVGRFPEHGLANLIAVRDTSLLTINNSGAIG